MDIIIPGDLWEGDAEGVLTAWLFDAGAKVSEGAIVAEVMTDKVQYELVAPNDGILRIRAELDAVVKRGDVIGSVDAG